MIVVDSSALLAILFHEPEKQAFETSSRATSVAFCRRSTRTRRRPSCVCQAVARLWQLLTDSEIEIVPFDETQVHAAAAAFDRYGKGIDPKARLNLADCAAYALAATMNAPLLFKGDDFAATDVRACL
jgi:ribonuclease VapC